MIKAMDILLMSERIMDGQSIDNLNDPDYLTIGALVTADINGSEDTVYKVIELTGRDSVKIQSQKTQIVYSVPREFLSPVLINNPINDVDIKFFKDLNKDTDTESPPDEIKNRPTDNPDTINQIGVKTPGESFEKKSKKTGIFLVHGQPQFAKSRFDRRQ